MVAFRLLLAAAASGLRAVDCAKVTGALSVLKKLGPPATSFCSSYLKIQGKTATTTFTPPAVTVTTSTTYITTYQSRCGQEKRNVPINYRGFQYAEPADLEQRGNILPLLAAFAAAKISEGCSCLGLQPKTVTTTTRTAAAQTTNVVATGYDCIACKGSGLDSTCSLGSQCCSGRCQVVLGTPSCCNAVGDYCDLPNPGACCNGLCIGTPEKGAGAGVCG
ncbi:hypothetical protein BKA66DRAFT_447873 [Pyrenochaeta sp. MPI-SDFR-AT-0127]|nr:hypothetical protein BKA66DRAFT_447873 [Pyrenochaeta sp. MPI-SDFR-AT-0127]